MAKDAEKPEDDEPADAAGFVTLMSGRPELDIYTTNPDGLSDDDLRALIEVERSRRALFLVKGK